jgi:hypothetical protein
MVHLQYGCSCNDGAFLGYKVSSVSGLALSHGRPVYREKDG